MPKGSDGAEQYGAQYPTGNISREQMDDLERRSETRSPEDTARWNETQTKAYRNRHNN